MDREQSLTTEHEIEVANGWVALAVFLGGIVLLILAIIAFPLLVPFVVVGELLLLMGFFTLQPNEARVLVLFGEYKGTVKKSGFHWANPFYSRLRGLPVAPHTEPGAHHAQVQTSQLGYKVSLRARTLNVETLKVNDKLGNPIEIAAVIVWRVRNTAQALFDVDNYAEYVRTQSETALRHLASHYAYDNAEHDEVTLRSNIDDISKSLCVELEARVKNAGVAVDEARLTHLAYAPEIAQAMLRRQQAEAVIAARQKIVHGAVSMVEMALNDLAERNVVEFDPARRAALVSNLMVVLCSESETHPVVNAGA